MPRQPPSPPLTAAGLLEQLAALGWSQRHLARLLNVDATTVNAWATGRREVPGYATAYLRLAVALRPRQSAAAMTATAPDDEDR